MLRQLTSAQVAEWLAFASLEQVGNPVPPDKEAEAKKAAKTKRAGLEGMLRRLKSKEESGNG